MARTLLLSPTRLDDLLRCRATGETWANLAKLFRISVPSVKNLLGKHRRRFHIICAEMGVAPPTRGGDQKKPTAAPAGTSVKRCLGCREDFNSWGPGNHMCGACQRTPAWRSGVDYAVNTGTRVSRLGAA